MLVSNNIFFPLVSHAYKCLGDIFGTLGGSPDFGPNAYNNNPVKRSLGDQKRAKGRRGGVPVKVHLN